MPTVVAKKCVPVSSSWVEQFILTCDEKLAVQFKGGVCCLYPTTTKTFFEIAIVSASPGKFVWDWVYNLPYILIKPPCPAKPCPGAIPTNCCEPDTPVSLYATVQNGGECNGSYLITWDGTGPNPAWKSRVDFGRCRSENGSLTLFFACSGVVNLWVLTAGPLPTSATASSCTPFIVTFAGLDLTGCGGLANATITVTS